MNLTIFELSEILFSDDIHKYFPRNDKAPQFRTDTKIHPERMRSFASRNPHIASIIPNHNS